MAGPVGKRYATALAATRRLGYCWAAVSLPSRAVLTIATTKPVFVRMAYALARSFFYWNRDPSLRFVLATDLAIDVPADLRGMEIVRVPAGSLGMGFSPKLHLDRLMPADRTLFLDSDCLCFGPLDGVFERFAGRPVGVVGDMLETGTWFCDIDRTRARLGLGPLPHFNGGLYYLERGPEVDAIYARARDLEAQYDALGLVRLRGRPNDEFLLSLALAERGVGVVPEDGTILGNLDTVYPVVHEVDVLRGRFRMSNPPPSDPRHLPEHPVAESRARIVHFLDYCSDKWPYRAEVLKLDLVQAAGLPSGVARLLVDGTLGLAGRSADAFREAFRPVYRRFFGVRRIQSTEKNTI